MSWIDDLIAEQQQAAAVPSLEEEEGWLKKLGSSALVPLQLLLEALDKPGRAVRGLFAGNPRELLNLLPIPTDSLSITDPNQATSGQDLLRQAEIIDDDGEDTWGKFFGGLATEIALDPLNAMTFGTKASLTAAGRKALKSNAGLLPKATERIAEGQSGLLGVKVPWFLGGSNVKPILTGEWGEKMAGFLERQGDRIANIPGMSHLGAGFQYLRGFTGDKRYYKGSRGQEAAQAAARTALGDEALEVIRPQIDALNQVVGGFGEKARAEAEDAFTHFFEQRKAALSPILSQTDLVHPSSPVLRQIPTESREPVLKLLERFASQAAESPYYDSGQKYLRDLGVKINDAPAVWGIPFSHQRQDEAGRDLMSQLKGRTLPHEVLPQGERLLRDLVSDPRIAGIARDLEQQKTLLDELRDLKNYKPQGQVAAEARWREQARRRLGDKVDEVRSFEELAAGGRAAAPATLDPLDRIASGYHRAGDASLSDLEHVALLAGMENLTGAELAELARKMGRDDLLKGKGKLADRIREAVTIRRGATARSSMVVRPEDNLVQAGKVAAAPAAGLDPSTMSEAEKLLVRYVQKNAPRPVPADRRLIRQATASTPGQLDGGVLEHVIGGFAKKHADDVIRQRQQVLEKLAPDLVAAERAVEAAKEPVIRKMTREEAEIEFRSELVGLGKPVPGTEKAIRKKLEIRAKEGRNQLLNQMEEGLLKHVDANAGVTDVIDDIATSSRTMDAAMALEEARKNLDPSLLPLYQLGKEEIQKKSRGLGEWLAEQAPDVVKSGRGVRRPDPGGLAYESLTNSAVLAGRAHSALETISREAKPLDQMIAKLGDTDRGKLVNLKEILDEIGLNAAPGTGKGGRAALLERITKDPAGVAAMKPDDIGEALSKLAVPADLADVLKKELQGPKTGKLGGLLDGLERYATAARTYFTVPFLPYHLRNTGDAFLQQKLAGAFDRKAIKDAADFMAGAIKDRGKIAEMRQFAEEALVHDVAFTDQPFQLLGKGIDNRGAKALTPFPDQGEGSISKALGGFFGRFKKGAVEGQGYLKLDPAKNQWAQRGVEAHVASDKLTRFSQFVALRREGWEPAAAAKAVAGAQLKYSRMTDLEQRIRSFVPFYSFSKENILRTGRQLQDPGALTSLLRLVTGARENTTVPDWASAGAVLPAGKDEQGRQNVVGGFGLAIEDEGLGAVISLLSGNPKKAAQKVASTLEPLSKTLIEQATDTQLYSGRRLSEQAPNRMLSFLPRDLAVALTQASGGTPAARFMSNVNKTTQAAMGDKGVLDSLLNLLTGVRVSSIDSVQAQNLAARAELDRQLTRTGEVAFRRDAYLRPEFKETAGERTKGLLAIQELLEKRAQLRQKAKAQQQALAP